MDKELIRNVRTRVPEIIRNLWNTSLHFNSRLRYTSDRGSTNITIQKKGLYGDIVTFDDLYAEKYIIRELSAEFPQINIVAEESLHKEDYKSNACFIIDPIDGTFNYSEDVPHYATSVSLLIEGIVVYGCVYDPQLNELYHCVKGEGVFLGKKRLGKMVEIAPERAILSYGVGRNRDNDMMMSLLFNDIRKSVKSTRQMGCASLDLCYVAAKRFAGFVHSSLNVWDYSAGAFFVEENGGKVRLIDMKDCNHEKMVIAGNSYYVKQMERMLSLVPEYEILSEIILYLKRFDHSGKESILTDLKKLVSSDNFSGHYKSADSRAVAIPNQSD